MSLPTFIFALLVVSCAVAAPRALAVRELAGNDAIAVEAAMVSRHEKWMAEHGRTYADEEEQARRLVNVTAMSERRKDAHPSVHRRQWEPITDAQARDASSYADCIHRCLPGVPDVWNQLLYAHIVS